MSRTKRGLIIAFTLLLIALLVSACEQPYSTPPAVTSTPIGPSLFATTIPNQPENMQDVENITTQTASADVPTQTPEVSGSAPGTEATATVTPMIALNPTFTATQAVVAQPTATSVPPTSGTEWVLKNGEFPYCIARRYNVDPADLIKASGLTSPDIYYEGQKLIIPQNSTWPTSAGPRSLLSHPGTYTVTGTSDTTVYGVACKYGDVDPAAIAQNNNISVGAALTVGQTLNIP